LAAELRSFYSDDYIWLIGNELAQITGINAQEFVTAALCENWPDLSLKERSSRLTDCLVCFLPKDPLAGIEVLKKLLPNISGDAQKYADMLCIFVPDYVCRYKDNLPLEGALEALCYFTCHGTTSELAIRPFLIDQPNEVLQLQKKWITHEHPNVRRWISEGCRPRLPWAPALPVFKKDPEPILHILRAFIADDSKFVQKSVANNLNDISKDNPDIVLQFAEEHIDQHPNTNWILKHALRGLLKAGTPRALALFGAAPVTLQNPKLNLKFEKLQLGQSQTFEFTAQMSSPLPAKLRLEYAVDFRKANGSTSRKVFMISEKEPVSRDINAIKSHKFINYTTRKHYAGIHSITILVNGTEAVSSDFTLNTV
jgi:3-methyladenine DNA glycosylase AlkC